MSLIANGVLCGDTAENIIRVTCDFWRRKGNFAGVPRYRAVSFSMGTKGYVGTGGDPYQRNDFWEWDQQTDTWTQKADMGGNVRMGAVGFSIGSKGYIGTGKSVTILLADFWEWDQATNVWTQKADLPGGARELAVGFSIGAKGYIGTGGTFSMSKKDFWEWDQATNVWTQKADFGGGMRHAATGFSIGNKGYIGTGFDYNTSQNLQDFWEWDQATDVWIQKNNFGGPVRNVAAAFAVGAKGYVVGGGNTSGTLHDCWQWDQGTDTWTQVMDLGTQDRVSPSAFSIGTKGYVCMGYKYSSPAFFYNDLWELNTCNTTLVPLVTAVTPACNGQCNGSITVGATGGTPPYAYSWNNGQSTQMISGLCAGSYTLTMTDAGSSNLVYVVNLTQPAVLTTSTSLASTICSGNCLSISSNVTGGNGGNVYQWLPGNMNGSYISVCPTNSTDYTLTVTDSRGCSAVSTSSVTVKPAQSTPTVTLSGPATFCQGSDLTLTSSSAGNYFWSTGETTQSIVVTGSGNYSLTATHASGCTAISGVTNVLVAPVLTASITPSGSTTFCQGKAVTLTSTTASTYSWSTGATTKSIVVNQSGAYSVTNSNACNSSTSPSVNVLVNPSPTVAVTAGGATSFCYGKDVTLSASGSAGSYLWNTGSTEQSIAANFAASFYVTITDGNGCTKTSSPVPVGVYANPNVSFSVTHATVCVPGNGSITATASTGQSPYSYSWNTGGTTAGITGLAPGGYSVTVTDAHGCTKNGSTSVSCVTGVWQIIDGVNFEISPNPGSGLFVVKGLAGEDEISVIDVFGRRINCKTFIEDNRVIDLSSKPDGIYFVVIRTREGIFTRKLVISR